MGTACKYCIMDKGLRLGDKHIFETDEEFYQHLEKDHHIPVRRDGETEEQTLVRFQKENPEAGGPNCRCPSCNTKTKAYDTLLQLINPTREGKQ